MVFYSSLHHIIGPLLATVLDENISTCFHCTCSFQWELYRWPCWNLLASCPNHRPESLPGFYFTFMTVSVGVPAKGNLIWSVENKQVFLYWFTRSPRPYPNLALGSAGIRACMPYNIANTQWNTQKNDLRHFRGRCKQTSSRKTGDICVPLRFKCVLFFHF